MNVLRFTVRLTTSLQLAIGRKAISLIFNSQSPLSHTEPSTKQILLTDDDAEALNNNNNKNQPNNNNKLLPPNSRGSEPTHSDKRPPPVTAGAKYPCSTSFPKFPSAKSSAEKQLINPEKECGSMMNSNQVVKGTRNKLRFNGENSFEEHSIAMSEFSLEEPNNNSLVKSGDQTILKNNVSNLSTGLTSLTNHNPLANNSMPNSDKCNTIFLGGINESNLTLKLDNV